MVISAEQLYQMQIHVYNLKAMQHATYICEQHDSWMLICGWQGANFI